MIESIALEQKIIKDKPIIFRSTPIRTKSSRTLYGWLDYEEKDGIFTLTKTGIYRINYQMIAKAKSTSTTLGFELYVNNIPLEASKSILKPDTNYEYSLSSTNLVRVAIGDRVPIKLMPIVNCNGEIISGNIIIEKVA